MKRVLYVLCLVVLCLVLASCSLAPFNFNQAKENSKEASDGNNQFSSNPGDQQAIKEINAILKQENFKGTLYIKNHNKVLMNEAVGEKNYKGEQLGTESMFLIGSSQKFLTGIIVKKLEDKGLIDRNQLVSFYLPQFYGMNMTIKNLLMHRSGLMPYRMTKKYRGLDATVNTIAENGMNLSLYNTYHYNDANYIVLAKVIEQVTQKTYKENVYQYIINPLKLKRTGFYDDKLLQPFFAEGYRTKFMMKTPIKPFGLDQFDGAGNIYMSAADMATLADAFYHNQLFSSQETNLMKTSIDDNVQPYRYGFNVKKNYLRLRGYFFNQEVICWFNNNLTIAMATNIAKPSKTKNNEQSVLKIYNILTHNKR
ncbi:beta-lactamase family protein [Macrococcus equipercicus]|uniref:Beta-lactamase family protein n=1 Tax=Macrococcus equipercicus TaxID=69967 RepID=A0ABQ6RBB5_9STAP|nr:serine hydrolase domain-containing protein [Macrococcus equipercicus]KAA1042527.1 beta-lactamase family protein [Macrococcus equipercicus]